LVSGWRRLQSCRLLGLETIPAIVKEVKNTRVSALVENIQRKDLSPFDKAKTLLDIKNEGGYTDEQLGQLVGLSRDKVRRLLTLNMIPTSVQEQCANSHIDREYFLFAVAKLESELEMIDAVQHYANHELSITQLQEQTKKKNKTDDAQRSKAEKINDREYRVEKYGISATFKSAMGPIDIRNVVRLCKDTAKDWYET
jgi:ParB family chromosome partitioning protein